MEPRACIQASSHARELHDPIGLPTLAAIVRERLLPSRGVGTELGPREEDLHGPTVVRVVAIELTAIAVEAADHRREERALLAVDPIDRPPPFPKIEHAEGHSRPALRGELDLVDV